ncbi:hypothetical protein [Cellulomonas sp. Marseille-Q8402]
MPCSSNLLTQYDAQEIDDTLGWFPISGEGTVATTIPDNKNGIVVFRTGDAEREAAAKQFLTFLMTDYYPTFIEDGGLVSIEPDVENPETVPQAWRRRSPRRSRARSGRCSPSPSRTPTSTSTWRRCSTAR